MSFLAAPRLAFAGRFLADVSTINNANPGGDAGWNPQGGGSFEFLDCRTTGLWREDGGVNVDPALGYAISGRPDRSSGKMVDLDPDWQMASQLWALSVRVFDPISGEVAVLGRYSVSSFRDIWARQAPELMSGIRPPNGQPMGARYISALTELEWGPAADRSPFLSLLKRYSPKRLSICFHQFGYFYTTTHERYRTGTLAGTIGPANGDPDTVLVERRFLPVQLNPKLLCMGPVDFAVSDDKKTVNMDLGHGLPITSVDGQIQDLGNWSALPQLKGCEALVLGLAQPHFDQFKAATAPVTQFGEVSPFSPGWYKSSGGIATISIDADKRDSLKQPLALYARMKDNTLVAMTQEVVDGLFVRADNFVFRMEAGTTATAIIYATKYGEPAANVSIYLIPQTSLDPPALRFPGTVVTDRSGKANITLEASDPGAPRPSPNSGQPAPDGQVYILGYSAQPPAAGSPIRNGNGLSQLDVLAVHVRQQLEVPQAPTWETDVQPILAGYATLYPIMSKHLFDLADYDAVTQHRAMLRLAFSRDIDDPNYMPVTRDLSESKRKIIQRWLQSETGDPSAPLRRESVGHKINQSRRLVAQATTPGPDTPDAKRDNAPRFSAPTPRIEKENSNDQD